MKFREISSKKFLEKKVPKMKFHEISSDVRKKSSEKKVPKMKFHEISSDVRKKSSEKKSSNFLCIIVYSPHSGIVCIIRIGWEWINLSIPMHSLNLGG